MIFIITRLHAAEVGARDLTTLSKGFTPRPCLQLLSSLPTTRRWLTLWRPELFSQVLRDRMAAASSTSLNQLAFLHALSVFQTFVKISHLLPCLLSIFSFVWLSNLCHLPNDSQFSYVLECCHKPWIAQCWATASRGKCRARPLRASEHNIFVTWQRGHLFCVCFCSKAPCLIPIVGSLTLNSQPTALLTPGWPQLT